MKLQKYYELKVTLSDYDQQPVVRVVEFNHIPTQEEVNDEIQKFRDATANEKAKPNTRTSVEKEYRLVD